MKRQNRKACLAAMLLLPCLAWGQQRLTLDHLLQLADEQSVSIKSYSAAVESALHNEASAKAARLLKEEAVTQQQYDLVHTQLLAQK